MNAVSWAEDMIHATEHHADDPNPATVCGTWTAREPIGFWPDLDRVSFGRPVFDFYVSCRECRERLGLSVEVPRPAEAPNVLGLRPVRVD